MTTSGTASWTPDLAEIIDEAFERCGVEGARSGYDVRTARRSLNLLFADFANKGLNLWTIDQGSIPLATGVENYALPQDTVDLLETVVRTNAYTSNQADLVINRISAAVYATIPNKNAQGRPIQMWVNRTNTPTVTVWPVPNNDTYELSYWRLRRIQDAGTGSSTVDMPFRFLPAMIAGLAYYLALKVPGGYERLQVLKAQYDEAWFEASSEDREKAPIRLTPRVGYI
jgi:hypothetical protein